MREGSEQRTRTGDDGRSAVGRRAQLFRVCCAGTVYVVALVCGRIARRNWDCDRRLLATDGVVLARRAADDLLEAGDGSSGSWRAHDGLSEFSQIVEETA